MKLLPTFKHVIHLNTQKCYMIIIVAYLKVAHRLCFHLFFSFLGAGLLMSFYGQSGIVVHHLYSATIMRCERSQVWMLEWRITFFFFFEQPGWCPPGSWCPTQTAYSAYRERRYCTQLCFDINFHKNVLVIYSPPCHPSSYYCLSSLKHNSRCKEERLSCYLLMYGKQMMI